MRYIHFYGSAGYCGTDYDDFDAFPDDTSDAFLNAVSEDKGNDCAETYSYLHTGWGEDFENEEDEDQYYENALSYCDWEELSKEEWEKKKEELG